MAAQTFPRSTHTNPDGPAGWAEAVTPSDTVDLAYTSRGIYVGVTGNVALITEEGNTVTFTAVPAGTTLAVKATRILATGTTATSLLALS